MKILLGICGSIAAYKSYDLCRYFVKEGHEVRVVLTQGATKFVQAEVFHYLGAQKVYSHDQDFIDPHSLTVANEEKKDRGTVLHVTLSQWCDRLVVAPLSANTAAKMSRGEASDLLTSIFLSLGPKPIILYPAMNTKMLHHPLTQENFRQLQKVPTLFIYPSEAGVLVCGDEGEGKFPPVDIVAQSALAYTPSLSSNLKAKKTILITAGATIAPLDPIRFLTNPSSGLTGLALTQQYLQEGHSVIVIAGQLAAPLFAPFLPLPSFQLRKVITTQDMEKEVLSFFTQADLYISTAAICDMEFTPSPEKLKKEEFSEQGVLSFKKSVDILAKVLSLKTPQQKIVGFAAETNPSAEILFEKWNRKKVDLLVGNKVDSGLLQKDALPLGFGTVGGHYLFVRKGKIVDEKKLSKKELAVEIYQKFFSPQ